MKTFATLFSGGEGVGVGLQAAGLAHLWGVEYDAQIATVAQANGFDVTVADVRAVDYAAMPRADWLHASPSCTRASIANANATEAQEDIEAATAVVRALEAQGPQVFTLENVWQYRTFAAFRLICDALGRLGYFWAYDHVNAADFGVPQTRKRLILRAARCLLPHLPQPVPWVGWYAAIADLLPTLPESKLAPWQLARLPEELRGAVLLDMHNATREATVRSAVEPSTTQGASMGSRPSHQLAVLVDGFGNTSREVTMLSAAMPCLNGQAWHGRRPVQAPRAVLVAGLLNSDSTKLTRRDGGEPSFTVTTSHNQKDVRADGGAHVVAMTPRCLARFQSFPDAYVLPEKRTLAARVIGNAVPPLLMQRIAEGLLGVL